MSRAPLEWQDQAVAAAPKYDAVLEFIANTTEVESEEESAPVSFMLSQSFPNPVGREGGATIEYRLSDDEIVRVRLFDVLGHEIKTVLDEKKNAGAYRLRLNAGDLPAGVYFFRMEIGGMREVRKLVVVR